jgi:hypothetical protein
LAGDFALAGDFVFDALVLAAMADSTEECTEEFRMDRNGRMV